MPLTLRLVKGSELTYAELDGNFTFITGSYTPLSVTSSMSVATASNVTPAIASNGVNRVITSDGDGTFTAEANLTFDGSTLLVTGSLTVSGSNTLRNIGPARFRGDTGNTATIVALEVTGGLQVSASIDSINRYLINDTGISTIDWQNNTIADATGNNSIEWETRRLLNTGGTGTVDYEGGALYDSNGVTSIGWETRAFRYPNGNTFLNYGTSNSALINITGSFVVSASGHPNATASLSIVSGQSGDWYDIALHTKTLNGYQSSSIVVSKYITLASADGFPTTVTGLFQVVPGAGSNNIVRIFNNSGSTGVVQIDPPTTFNDILTITPRSTTPTGVATGSFIVSGSGANVKPYFFNGATWTALF